MNSAARPGLANFKRPRRYVFVNAIPRSPVGKLLRRKLVAGEYEPQPAVAPLTESLSQPRSVPNQHAGR